MSAKSTRKLFHDTHLEINGEPLVNPEVVPSGVSRKFRSSCGQLMCNQAYQAHITLIPLALEGQSWIFHSSERERRRIAQACRSGPNIQSVHLFSIRNRILPMCKLIGRGYDHLGSALYPERSPC